MKLSLTAPKNNGAIVIARKKLLPLSFFCLLLSGICINSAAHAVMPPAHYEKQVQQSAIKAVAVVQDVIVLSETKQHTRKKIIFTLEKPLEKNIPQEFTGICYSVDHKWQEPGVGGTIYYYPAKGTKVLVTILNNHSLITSLTPLDAQMVKEIEANGLTNISFVMGCARIRSAQKQEDREEQWFLFYLNGGPSGYLRMTSRKDNHNPAIRHFRHEFLVGLRDKDRQIFRMNTLSRDNGFLTPERITIQITECFLEKTITRPQTEIRFLPMERKDIKEGILAKDTHNAYDVPIPIKTATDFGLFTLIETFPYENDFSVYFNLIEILELHFKINIQIRYAGRDSNNKNLHMFSQTGMANAAYWLDDRHELIELQWDGDKRFVRGTKEEAMTILQ